MPTARTKSVAAAAAPHPLPSSSKSRAAADDRQRSAPPGSASRSRRRRRAGASGGAGDTASTPADFASDDGGFMDGPASSSTTSTLSSSSSAVNVAALSSSSLPPKTPGKRSSSSRSTSNDGSISTTSISKKHSQSVVPKSSSEVAVASAVSLRPQTTTKKKSRRNPASTTGAADRSSTSSSVEASPSAIEDILSMSNKLSGKPISSSTLLRTIARSSAAAAAAASKCDNSSSSVDRQIEGDLLLEEKLGDILSIVKKCIRAAMSSSSSSTNGNSNETPSKTPRRNRSDNDNKSCSETIEDLEVKIAHLRLAVHSLRAISPLAIAAATSTSSTDEGGRKINRDEKLAENTARLMYHAIIAAEDVFIGAPSGTSTREDNVESAERVDAACLCLASCSVLSSFLSGCGVTSFRASRSRLMSVGVRDPSPLMVSLAHMPTDTLARSSIGSMTAVQVAKIIAQSLLSVSAVLSSLFLSSLGGTEDLKRREDEIANEFGFSLLNNISISGRSLPSTITSSTVPLFQALVRTSASCWLIALANGASKDGIDGALSYSKRFQRMLWDCASMIEKKVSLLGKRNESASYLRRLSLGLRGDSILASLLVLCVDDEQIHRIQDLISSTPELRRTLFGDRMEYACGCAWKAAVSYSQSVTSASATDPTWSGGLGRSNAGLDEAERNALTVFHLKIGQAIDEIIGTRLEIVRRTEAAADTFPFSYIEYCAYRALHVGPGPFCAGDERAEECNNKENSSSSSSSSRRKNSSQTMVERCKKSGCLYSGLPFVFVHGHEHLLSDSAQANESLCQRTTLCITFSVLQAYRCVFVGSEQPTGAEYGLRDELISRFHSSLLSANNGKRPKLSVLLQCQKMLALLKLTSKAMVIIKENKEDKGGAEEGLILAVEFIQRVLGECYAPLLARIASVEMSSSKSKEEGESKSTSRIEMAQECYIRAVMLSDLLHELRSSNQDEMFSAGAKEVTASANKALHRAFQLTSGSSEKNVITVARSIAAIGKQRVQREKLESALTPMLLSAELFASIFESSRSAEYNLPTRYQQLASIFESLGMPNETITSLVLALHYQLRETTMERSPVSVTDTAILRCVEAIGGGEGPFALRKGDANPSMSHHIVARLIRSFTRHCHPSVRHSGASTKRKITPGTFVETLNGCRIGKIINKVLCLQDEEDSKKPLPLYRIFQLLIAHSNTEGLDLSAQIEVLNQALYMIGTALAGAITTARNDNGKGGGENDERKTWIGFVSKEFTGFLKLALTCPSKGREAISAMEYRKYEASTYLSASVSFFVNRSQDSSLRDKSFDDESVPNVVLSAYKYAKKAACLLESASKEIGDGDEQVLLQVQQLAADFYVSELSREAREDLQQVSHCEKLLTRVENLISYFKQHRHEVSSGVSSCLAFILASLHSQLELSGNSKLSIQCAALVTQLPRSTSILGKTNPSDEALLLSNLGCSLMGGGYHGTCRRILRGFLQREYGCTSDSYDATTEESTRAIFARQDISIHELDFLASVLLEQVQSSYSGDNLDDAMQTLEDIVAMTEENDDYDTSTTWVQASWIQSACLLTLAQGMEKNGSVARALAYYKGCSRICRKAMAFIHGTERDQATHNHSISNTATCILLPANMFHRFCVRLCHCLQGASKLYCRLGDYRKGEGYALSVVEALNALPDTSTKISKSSTDDLCLLLRALSGGTVRQADALQFFVEIQALSRDVVMVSSELGKKRSLIENKDTQSPEWELQNIRSMMWFGDMLQRGTEINSEASFMSLYQISYEFLLRISSRDLVGDALDDVLVPMHKNEGSIDQHGALIVEARLRRANGDYADDGSATCTDAMYLYRQVAESGYTSGISRARSYYRLGLRHLIEARKNGELHRLWSGHSECPGVTLSSRDNIADAREEEQPAEITSAKEYLTRAASLAGPASTLLSRQIMRSLALATGPYVNSDERGFSAAALVHSSVGSTCRQKVSRAYATSLEEEESDESTLNRRLAAIFEALDSPLNDKAARNSSIAAMYQEACKVVPNDWRFAAIAICPSGEMLMSSLCFDSHDVSELSVREQTVCIFPMNSQETSSSCIYQGILKPFDDIMERSRVQLNDMDSSSLDRYSGNDKKRMWWEEREAIDDELCSLLRSTESTYFSSNAVRNLFHGETEIGESVGGDNYVASMCQGFDDISSNSDDDEDLECSLGNLADKFEAACAVIDHIDADDDRETEEPAKPPEKMTVVQIKGELEKLGIDKSAFKKLKKSALIELLHLERKNHTEGVLNKPFASSNNAYVQPRSAPATTSLSSRTVEGISSASTHSSCTFLILDEDLQRFPFEGFKSMEGRPICRIPSVAFAVATLLEQKQQPVKPMVSYVLDPEANLASTKRTMLSALDSLTSKYMWKWKRVAGEVPSAEFMETALTNNEGLFLYCGHGGGEKCFSRGEVEQLMLNGLGHNEDSTNELRRCSATIILMGCSSGKLISINGSRSNPLRNLAFEFEPEGMALSYLCAGAPCVVGNLWDVTDRDIDRYCMALLEDFLDPRDEMKNLPRCVADARSVCKMRHIVGCAPVVYGVPVVAQK